MILPRRIAVIGAGPAGLMAAETVAGSDVEVTVYEAMPSVGRKFLLAGRGGLNLTHSEDLEPFLAHYGAAAPRLRPAIESFPPAALRQWSEKLGQETFVGTSGRVFPKSLKTSPLLRAWLQRLDRSGVRFRLRHRWIGWDEGGDIIVEAPSGRVTVPADAVILALGGASWPKLGSDGGWVPILEKSGIAIVPLRPANCGFIANWTGIFRDRFEGQPLKRIALSFGGRTVRGEAIITRDGLEGGGVYALSAPLREAIAGSGEAVLTIALRPDMSAAELQQRLQAPRGKQSLSNVLRKAAKLSPVAIGLLHEAVASSSKKLNAMSAAALAELINAVPVRLVATAPIEGAISSAGGISFDEIDKNFMLRRRPGVFVAGEMLDWEAPTGGYLLQACFSTGAAAGRGVLAWLRDANAPAEEA
ncbi:MAG TPA: TIGR03862 family flavoprotein [Xanthobacteraceae bacterium]|nr:TIGR03862 family flavoprotein [Xanthobacteraceae bacterium]